MYILYSAKLNKYYVGACTELERRLYEHNIGHSTFTSLGVPWKLVYKETFETLQEAKSRELKIYCLFPTGAPLFRANLLIRAYHQIKF